MAIPYTMESWDDLNYQLHDAQIHIAKLKQERNKLREIVYRLMSKGCDMVHYVSSDDAAPFLSACIHAQATLALQGEVK